MVGVPVIINHKDLNKDNADDERVGVVNSVWFDEKDGWYWCDGIIWDETAQNLITDKNWAVSCSYYVKTADNKGGSENNIKYDMEFLDGVFTHLALVSNPRYERANIVFNSKTEVLNDRWVTIKPNGQDKKGRHLLIKDGENVYDAMRRQWGVDVPGQQHLFDRKKYKSDTSYKDELRGKIAEHLKTVQKRYDNLEYLGVAEPDKLKDEDYEDISFEEQQQEDIDKGELVELGKFPSKFTSEYPKGFIDDKKEDKRLQLKFPGKPDETTRSLLKSNGFRWSPREGAWQRQLTGNAEYSLKRVVEKLKANNDKEQDMALIEELKKLITKVENDKGDDMEDKEKIENEKVDKRELIDKVAGMMKSAGCSDEIIKTAIKDMEKESYDDSEASADNKKAKVKNEDIEDKDKVADLKEDEKKDVENKCKNSVDNSKGGFFEKMNEIYNSSKEVEQPVDYVSREAKIQAANDYFAK